MSSILIPKGRDQEKNANSNSSFLPVAGAFASTVFGAGPGLGQAVGGAASSSMYGKNAQDRVIEAPDAPNVDPQSESAMQRRQNKMQQDPYEALAQANHALQNSPADMQQAYKRPLEEAMAMAKRARDAGGVA